MLEFWGIWSTLLLPSLSGPIGPGVVATDEGPPIYGSKLWFREFLFLAFNGVLMQN